ncbi:hypothetical protein QJS04_geneDACA010086 [Acorus gramineus]|uniref:Uncharacterized protein n=1 Tax=Acorus gramineus TaxID=55184 RepID=A0AAV9BK11_ACOGR|nr:hypothetical protein QJS04_geneDACA010086 [Acorus gramineus]
MSLKITHIGSKSPGLTSSSLRPSAGFSSHRVSMASTICSGTKEVDYYTKKKKQPPLSPPRDQVTHSMPAEKAEIFKSLNEWASENVLVHLKPVEKSWQAQDFLPEPSSDGFIEEVDELRSRAKELPDEYLVCLVGDMITEEALPTYQTMLNTADGVRDETGASLTSWAVWTRAWTAEENRHGDLLNKYLIRSNQG